MARPRDGGEAGRATASERSYREIRYQAAMRVGQSLDIVRTAQDLVDVLVPAMADLASVTLADAVLVGDEPVPVVGGGEMHQRRVAVAAASGVWPAKLLQPGEQVPRFYPKLPLLDAFQRGETLVHRDRESALAMYDDPVLIRAFAPDDGHSLIISPLFARGLVLGGVNLWRTDQPEPFTDEDVEVLREIVSHAAVAVENARRYEREHRAATALQRRLLPRATTDTAAAETAGHYVPAGGGADIGGDWFDVIPLPSLRVALIVGDVVGHGLHATAAMGRLRSTVQTLAELGVELDPAELLGHVDHLVRRQASEAGPGLADGVTASLLYAVYDPVSRDCAVATAGHPPPVVLRPGGTAEPVPVEPGPMLGVGGMAFEITTVRLEPGSVLALYTDGLTGRDPDEGLRRFLRHLSTCGTLASLETTSRELVARTAPQSPQDDVALLLARVRSLPEDAVVEWEFTGDPAAMANVRGAVTSRLAAWGLDHLTFSVELIVSELATNAIRHARGPYRVRLIHDGVLVCEVTDHSNTQPRIRRAAADDEGGRGVFLVAQLAVRWGSRFLKTGKTVWAEL